jgi:hypothetical protein
MLLEKSMSAAFVNHIHRLGTHELPFSCVDELFVGGDDGKSESCTLGFSLEGVEPRL